MSRARAHLVARRAQPIWSGHPWVFAGALHKLEGAPQAGDLVEVVDARGRSLGVGFFHPEGALKIRMLHGLATDQDLTGDWLRERLAVAKRLREETLGLNRADNRAYRLCNAEGDGLPGLIIDRFGDVLVVQVTSSGFLRRIKVVLEALEALYPEASIVGVANRDAAKIESWSSLGLEPDEIVGVLKGDPGESHLFLEEGLRFRLPLGRVQKTGHYLDQRENRLRFAQLVEGRVLDLHTFSGGFALQAARLGAQVVAVDSSPVAVGLTEDNASLNALSLDIRKGRADGVLAGLAESGERFNAVNLDPPKLAPRKRNLEKGLRAYGHLVKGAMAVLEPGGILAISSCSQMIGPEDLARVVAKAAGDQRRWAQLLSNHGPPADHPSPAAARETRYLSCAFFAVR